MNFHEKFIVTNSFKKLTKRARFLLQTYHYRKSYRSLKQVYVFHLRFSHSNRTMGVAVFGKSNSRFNNNELELRRLCLVSGAPKHLTGWFLAKCLKEIKKLKTYSKVITFADPNQKHSGTIYKATNWTHVGKEKAPNPRICIINDTNKTVHMRQIYAKINGQYTPSAINYQNMIKQKKATIKNILHKEKFEYTFSKRGKK